MLILRRKHREVSLTMEGDRAFEARKWKLAEAEGASRRAKLATSAHRSRRYNLGHMLRMQRRQQEAAYLQVIRLHSANTEALTGSESLSWSERQLTALRHV